MTKRKSSKESMSHLFNRYVWLCDLIYRRRKITYEEINDAWCNSSLNDSGSDLPLKTFHNHRHAIESMFDINIECDKRNGYVYYIDNSDDMQRGGVRQWFVGTFAVNNLINESHKLKHRILFENIPSGQQYLTIVIEAMRDARCVEIEYQSFGTNEPQTITIEPYCVKVFKQRWYVVGKSEKGVRIYSLDRISNIVTTETPYILQNDFNADDFFAGAYGILVNENVKTETVRIKAKGIKAKYIEALPLHHSQNIEEQGADYTIYSYQISPTFDLRQELLSHGDEVEVLSPAWFRNEIKEIINEQFKVYGK